MMQGDRRGVGICLGTSGAVIALARSQPPRLVALASVSWPYGLWQHPGLESGDVAGRGRSESGDVAGRGGLESGDAAGRGSWESGDVAGRGKSESGPPAVARQMLVRARRQLALPRWCPVSVVIGPSLSDYAPEDVLAGSAGLLARAGLSQAWVTATDRAEVLRREMTVATGALGAAAAGHEAGLAIGAALASLPLPPAPAAMPAVARAVVPAVAPGVVPGVAPAAGPVAVPVPVAAPLLVPAVEVGSAGWALQRIGDVEEPAEYAMTSHRE